jgi:hypothetical protein
MPSKMLVVKQWYPDDVEERKDWLYKRSLGRHRFIENDISLASVLGEKVTAQEHTKTNHVVPHVNEIADVRMISHLPMHHLTTLIECMKEMRVTMDKQLQVQTSKCELDLKLAQAKHEILRSQSDMEVLAYKERTAADIQLNESKRQLLKAEEESTIQGNLLCVFVPFSLGIWFLLLVLGDVISS